MSDPLLQPRPEGLYCPAGDFFIDPMLPVARAVDDWKSRVERMLAQLEKAADR